MDIPPPPGYNYVDRIRILNSNNSEKHINFIKNLLLNEKLTDAEKRSLEADLETHVRHQLMGLHNSPGGSRRRANKHSKKSRKSRKTKSRKSN